METHIAPVTAGSPHELFDLFRQAIDETSTENTLLLGGFAYATLGGARQFVSYAETSESWDSLSKHFVVGIHHGISEPSALEFLRSVPKSEVRIFIPGGRLTPAALVATPLFHPKIFALANTSVRKLKFLQAGSANMTSSAMGDVPKNYELSIALKADGNASLGSSRAFKSWWSSIWSYSRVVDNRLIERYAALRLNMLEQNPVLRYSAGPPENIRSAQNFFVEVGAASGPPGRRHQIEFPESLVAFFGPSVPHRRGLTLSSNGVIWNGRPLSYKVTTYGVEIWRLGMPTQTTGGEPIAHRTIRFERTNDPNLFEYEVADTQSNTFAEWKKAANSLGHIGATHGMHPRTYGYY